MVAYPNLAAAAPQLVSRVTGAVDALDADALCTIDAEVRRLVASLIAAPGARTVGVLTELADLYGTLRARSEDQRADLQRLLGEHRRAQAGLLAYRSSGATSLNP
jgi:hypothetical protein